jgi:hypothetical protein
LFADHLVENLHGYEHNFSNLDLALVARQGQVLTCRNQVMHE